MKVRMSANLKAVLNKAGLIMPTDSKSVDELNNLLGRFIVRSKSLSDAEVQLFSKACAELERIASIMVEVEYQEAVKRYEAL